MADTFTSGTLGRVRTTANVVVAGVNKWSFDKPLTTVRIPHFESTADADGIVHPGHLKGLAGPHTGNLEGYINSDSVNQTDGATINFSTGLTVTLDLIVVKATPFGWTNLSVTITNLHTEVAVENQPARFTANFEVNGDPGKMTTVT